MIPIFLHCDTLAQGGLEMHKVGLYVLELVFYPYISFVSLLFLRYK